MKKLVLCLVVATLIATGCASPTRTALPTVEVVVLVPYQTMTSVLPTRTPRPTETPTPGQFDAYGRFSWLDVEGECAEILGTWYASPGVVVRNNYGEVEYAEEFSIAYVDYTAYPVVVIKDSGETSQTWVVDFGYDPVRVYAQDDYFWAGLQNKDQFQPLDPDPYLERALEILPSHIPIVVRSEWHWMPDADGDYGWDPSTVCLVP